jgi:DNA anti-recombination protein RmuC
MTEEIRDVNKQIDQLDAAAKKYASRDTVISIGGYEFTPAKLMVALTIVSSTLGGLYGTFEVYKDYMSMKKKIAEYVTPDLTEIYKKLELVEQSSAQGTQYTQDIKNDLKTDIRRLENLVEQVERANRQSQRETQQEAKDLRREVGDSVKDLRREVGDSVKNMERTATALQRQLDSDTRAIRKEVDDKIRRALDNPLAK